MIRTHRPLFLFSIGALAILFLIGSNSYFGPTSPVPGNPQLVKVQILIRDSAQLGGVKILSVEFDGQSIPLKPADIYGIRGEAGFQKKPGKYALKWTVERDQVVWPRRISHEEEVAISPRDLWIQITIEGDQASIR